MKISGRENKSGFKGQRDINLQDLTIYSYIYNNFLSALLSVSCGLVYYDIRENESGRKTLNRKALSRMMPMFQTVQTQACRQSGKNSNLLIIIVMKNRF